MDKKIILQGSIVEVAAQLSVLIAKENGKATVKSLVEREIATQNAEKLLGEIVALKKQEMRVLAYDGDFPICGINPNYVLIESNIQALAKVANAKIVSSKGYLRFMHENIIFEQVIENV